MTTLVAAASVNMNTTETPANKRTNTFEESLDEIEELMAPVKRSRSAEILEFVSESKTVTEDYHFTNLIWPVNDETLPVPINTFTLLMDLDECLVVGSDAHDYQTIFQYEDKSFEWQVNFTKHLFNPEAVQTVKEIQENLAEGKVFELVFYTSKSAVLHLFPPSRDVADHMKIDGTTTFESCLSEITVMNRFKHDGVARIFYIREAAKEIFGLSVPPTMLICSGQRRSCAKVVHHAAWMLQRHPENCVLFDNTAIYSRATQINPVGSVVKVGDYTWFAPEKAAVVRQILFEEFGDQRPVDRTDTIDIDRKPLYGEVFTQFKGNTGCYDVKSKKLVVEEEVPSSWAGLARANPRIARFLR